MANSVEQKKNLSGDFLIEQKAKFNIKSSWTFKLTITVKFPIK